MNKNKADWKAIRVLISMVMMIGIFGSLWLETEYPVHTVVLFAVLFGITYWDATFHAEND